MSGAKKVPRRSGRDRIAAPSSVYIVCQSFDLEVFNPPKIFFAWQEAKALVVMENLGRASLCVPSRQEAIIAIEAAGCEVPPALWRH